MKAVSSNPSKVWTMRLPIIFLVVFLTTFVYADGIAKGYERIGIYYAFLLDLKAASANGGTRTILLSCGTDSTFRDVMQAFDYEDLGIWELLPDETERLPPVKETAKHFYDIGLTAPYDYKEVIADARGYPDFIERLGIAMDKAKTHLSSVDPESWRSVSDALDESLRMARENRVVELFDFIWRAQNDLPGIRKSKVVTESGEGISWRKTEADNSGVPDVRGEIQTFLAEYFRDDQIASGHRTVFNSMNFAYNIQWQISCGN